MPNPRLLTTTVRSFTSNVKGQAGPSSFMQFGSIEQAMQYAKTFSSKASDEDLEKVRAAISATTDPEELRRLGASIPSMDEPGWNDISLRYLEHFTRASFSQNREDREALLAASDEDITFEPDGTRWPVMASDTLRKVRDDFAAQMEEKGEIGRIYAFNPENAAPRKIEPVPERNQRILADENNYDILTLGTGKRTPDGFFSLIPPDVTMIVDTRNYRENNHAPHFGTKQFLPAIADRGLKYEHLKNLSGKSKDPAYALQGKPKEFDWTALAASEEFRADYDRLKELASSGERILVISGDSDPRFGNRALLLGQHLEADGITVGHIDTDAQDNGRLRSHQDVIGAALGHVSIQGGGVLNVHFNSDRSYRLDEGVSLQRHSANSPAEERIISGNWNYGRKVDISVSPSPDAGFKSAFLENVENTDVTILVSIGKFDPVTKKMMGMAAGKFVTVNIHDRDLQLGEAAKLEYRTTKDLLSDPEYMDKVASDLRESISRNIARRTASNPMLNIDLSNLRVNIAGSHIARIANEMVINSAQEDLTGNDLSVMAEGGLHPETTAISQEEVNAFMTGVLSRLNAPHVGEEFGQEENAAFRVGHVRTYGETGVAEAAVVAAQSLAIESSVLAPHDWGVTIDNEDPVGLRVRDRALLCNVFHQGLKNDTTQEDLVEAVTQRNAERHQDEDLGVRPGLTDTQILILQRLGYENSDIVTISEIADARRMFISTDAELSEFLLDCAAGYGIPGAEFINPEVVEQRHHEVDDLVFRASEQGIGFITLNSPEYPENLHQFKDIIHHSFRDEVSVEKMDEDAAVDLLDKITRDGVIHTELIPEDVLKDGRVKVTKIPQTSMERRPAILWYKGNLDLLKTPTLSAVGNQTSIEEMIRDAKDEIYDRIEKRKFENGESYDVARPDQNLRPSELEELSAASEAADTITGAARALGTTMAGEDVTVVAPMENTTARIAMDEAVARGGNAIGFSAESLDSPEMADGRDGMVRKGSLVLSEKAPGEKTTRKDRQRARVFSTALGYTTAFIEGFVAAKPLSPFELASYSLFAPFVLMLAVPAKIEKIAAFKDRTEGCREAAGKGMETATTGDLKKIADAAKNNYGVGAEEKLSDNERRPDRGENEKENERVDLHPHQLMVPLIKYKRFNVFLVGEEYPDVREALKKKYGDKVRFASPGKAEKVYSNLEHMTVSFGGDEMEGFARYRGTQPQEAEPVITPMFYNEGDVYSLLDAPNTTTGLITKHQRLENGKLFEVMKKQALEMQREMQKAVGLTTARPYRFETADYLFIKSNSIEVRRGDDVRAKIYIAPNGEIRVSNQTSLTDDLQAHGVKQFPLFSSTNPIRDAEQAKTAMEDLKEAIFNLSKSEAQYNNPTDREQIDALNEEIKSGFYTPRTDNISNALVDVAEGQRAGLISDGLGDRIDNVEAFGRYSREMAKIEANITKMKADLKKSEDSLAASTRTLTEGNAGDAKLTAEERLELKAARQEEVASLEERCAGIRDVILKDTARLAYLTSHRRDILNAKEINVVNITPDGKTKGLEIDGLVFAQSNSKSLTQKQRDEAQQEMEKLQSRGKAGETEVSAQQQIRTATQTAQQYEEKRTAEEYRHKEEKKSEEAQATARKASSTDILSDIANDRVVVSVNGGKAIADKDLNILSPVYEELYTVQDMLVGQEASGKYKLLRPDGELLIPASVEKVAKGDGNTVILRKDGEFNFLDIPSGNLLSENWLPKVGGFRDGWSLVQAPSDGENAGKFNFIKADGKMMTENWFSEATEFNNGVAMVKRGDSEYKIGSDGCVLEVLARDESISKAPGGPGAH